MAGALGSLRYNKREEYNETRGGVLIHNGGSFGFHEWEFRTLMRWQAVSAKGEEEAVSYTHLTLPTILLV